MKPAAVLVAVSVAAVSAAVSVVVHPIKKKLVALPVAVSALTELVRNHCIVSGMFCSLNI